MVGQGVACEARCAWRKASVIVCKKQDASPSFHHGLFSRQTRHRGFSSTGELIGYLPDVFRAMSCTPSYPRWDWDEAAT